MDENKKQPPAFILPAISLVLILISAAGLIFLNNEGRYYGFLFFGIGNLLGALTSNRSERSPKSRIPSLLSVVFLVLGLALIFWETYSLIEKSNAGT